MINTVIEAGIGCYGSRIRGKMGIKYLLLCDITLRIWKKKKAQTKLQAHRQRELAGGCHWKGLGEQNW